jgi:ABC-type branched-subunit amino acid transport system substrate-binding protein
MTADGPGNGGDGDPGLAGGADELVAGIGNERCTGVGDQCHRFVAHAGEELRTNPVAVVIVIGHHRPLDADMMKELRGDPAVFDGDDAGRRQHRGGARAEIGKIADRRGHDIEAGRERRVHEAKVMTEQSHRPQARRSRIGPGLAASLAFALGGCQLVPTASPQGAAPERAQPQPQPQVQAQAEPARPEQRRPETLPPGETRHRIAVLVPLTGANAGVGQSIANAANLALIDTGGERIRITVYDTAKGAQAAADQALADGNGLFLGPLLAEDVRAVGPLAARNGVPVVSFSNDVSVAGSGVYLLGFTPGQSVQRVVAFARAQGAQRFAALVPEGTYGRRAGQAMVGAVAAAGATLTGSQTFTRGTIGMRSAITKLNASGQWDAVLVADSGRVGAAAAPLLRASPSGAARILGTELWSTEADLGSTPALRGAWYAGPSDTMFNQLRSRYRARYGGNPYRLASLGYDSVLLALRVAKDWRVGRPFPEGELRDRRGFAGVDGAFRFGADNIAERSLEVREVTATGTTVVSAAPRDFE